MLAIPRSSGQEAKLYTVFYASKVLCLNVTKGTNYDHKHVYDLL